MVELLSEIAKQRNKSFLTHNLVDFLTTSLPYSSSCQYNLDMLIQICNYLGIPLTLEKVEGLSSTLPFLGIPLDIKARLPDNKLGKLNDKVFQWVTYMNVKK